MPWQQLLKSDPLPWLLEPRDPGVRYLAMRDLQKAPATDKEFRLAKKAAHEKGPIASILKNMKKEGYWMEPGPGYNPKYRATIWAIIELAQLGARVEDDPRISTACAYYLDHAFAAGGQISASGSPSGTADCMQGNVCWAMRSLGVEDPRLQAAEAWMARSVTGDGIAPKSDKNAEVRYYAGKCGPLFACGSNLTKPCAWGAVKVMRALGAIPEKERTSTAKKAIGAGIDFLLGTDPAKADYPTMTGGKPNASWWKIGFPVFYVTDILQIAESLAALGCADDPRLTNALRWIGSKQNPEGKWPLEYSYKGKNWTDYGAVKEPNKWATLRAVRVLQSLGKTQIASVLKN